MVIKH